MCGRYVWDPGEKAYVWAGAYTEKPTVSPWAEEWLNTGHYNIAPTQSVVAAAVDDGELRFEKHHWGLVPFWAKSLDALKYKPINARVEGLAEKPMFRAAAKEGRRCLIPASGFYEWTGSKGDRTPHYIHQAGSEPFMFAGLWERWRDRESDDDLLSCTIITTEANDWMVSIHDRQPVILPERFYRDWLDPQLPWSDVSEMLSPSLDGIELQEHVVTTEVNSSRNRGGPEFLEPADGSV